MKTKSTVWDIDFPASRNTDPNTSKKAEAQMNLGSRQKRARQVLQLVDACPNSTSGELSVIWYGRRNLEMKGWCQSFSVIAATPHKRLPDLEAMGLVERGSVRKCSDSGVACVTWHITERGKRELDNE